MLLRRLVYHLGAEPEAEHLLQGIAEALGLCIEGTGLESEPCLTELQDQKPMREAIWVEWEAVRAWARTAREGADTHVVIQESLSPPGQATQQLQVPLREVVSPPVQAMGPPQPSPRSQAASETPLQPQEPQERAPPPAEGEMAVSPAQGPMSPQEEPHPMPAMPGATAMPEQEPRATSPSRVEHELVPESPRQTPCLLDSAGVGQGRKLKELQKPTPGSPSFRISVDPTEEEEFLQSHEV